MPLSDDELCVLNNLIYSDEVYRVMGSSTTAGKHPTLLQVIEQAKVNPKGGDLAGALITEGEWHELVAAVRHDPRLRSLTVYDVDANTSQGSRNVCLMDGEGTPIVVMRGTGRDSETRESEWPDNCDGLAQSDTHQQIEARAYLEYVHARTGRKITATGHSKGGNKVMYGAVTTGCVERCVAFDGQGFNSDFLRRYAEQIEERRGRIINYHPEGDYVNCLLHPIAGREVYVESRRLDGSYLKNHSPIALLDHDMGLGRVGRQTAGSRQINAFTVWLDQAASFEDKQHMAHALGALTDRSLGGHEGFMGGIRAAAAADPAGCVLLLAYLLEYPPCDDLLVSVISECVSTPLTSLTDSPVDALVEGWSDRWLRSFATTLLGSGAGALKGLLGMLSATGTLRRRIRGQARGECAASPSSSTLVHDFSEATLDELRGIVGQVEAEPWYDVSRWDEWYQDRRFFGRLRSGHAQADVTAACRVTDVAAEAAEREMCHRFKQAWRRDATYARQLATMAADLSSVRSSVDGFTYGIEGPYGPRGRH